MPIDTIQGVLIALILLLVVLTLLGSVAKDVFPYLNFWGKSPGMKQYAIAGVTEKPIVFCGASNTVNGLNYNYFIQLNKFELSFGSNSDSSIKKFAALIHFKGYASFTVAENEIGRYEKKDMDAKIPADLSSMDTNNIVSVTLWKYEEACFDKDFIVKEDSSEYKEFYARCVINYLDRFDYGVTITGDPACVGYPKCDGLNDQQCLSRADCYLSANGGCKKSPPEKCADISLSDCGFKIYPEWNQEQLCYKSGTSCKMCTGSSCDTSTTKDECERYSCGQYIPGSMKSKCKWMAGPDVCVNA